MSFAAKTRRRRSLLKLYAKFRVILAFMGSAAPPNTTLWHPCAQHAPSTDLGVIWLVTSWPPARKPFCLRAGHSTRVQHGDGYAPQTCQPGHAAQGGRRTSL